MRPTHPGRGPLSRRKPGPIYPLLVPPRDDRGRENRLGSIPPPSEPDVWICRVAQPLLAFAPTDPTVRRYRSGLFRTDLRRMDHLCLMDCRFREWEDGQNFLERRPGHVALLAS